MAPMMMTGNCNECLVGRTAAKAPGPVLPPTQTCKTRSIGHREGRRSFGLDRGGSKSATGYGSGARGGGPQGRRRATEAQLPLCSHDGEERRQARRPNRLREGHSVWETAGEKARGGGEESSRERERGISTRQPDTLAPSARRTRRHFLRRILRAPAPPSPPQRCCSSSSRTACGMRRDPPGSRWIGFFLCW